MKYRVNDHPPLSPEEVADAERKITVGQVWERIASHTPHTKSDHAIIFQATLGVRRALLGDPLDELIMDVEAGRCKRPTGWLFHGCLRVSVGDFAARDTPFGRSGFMAPYLSVHEA